MRLENLHCDSDITEKNEVVVYESALLQAVLMWSLIVFFLISPT